MDSLSASSLATNAEITIGDEAFNAAGNVFTNSNENTITNEWKGDLSVQGGQFTLGSSYIFDASSGNVVTNKLGSTPTAFSPDTFNQRASLESSGSTGNSDNNKVYNEFTGSLSADVGTIGISTINQSGAITVGADGNSGGDGNEVHNTITLNDTLNLRGDILGQNAGISDYAGSSNNKIYNRIEGHVTVGDFTDAQGTYSGALTQFGQSSGSLINGNEVSNVITGHVLLKDTSQFIIDGIGNIVEGGVETQSTRGTNIGSTAHASSYDSESSANHLVNEGGQLRIGIGSSATVDKTASNRVVGNANLGIEGSITVTGEGSVLGLGSALPDNPLTQSDLALYDANITINNEVGKQNTASGGDQLQTVTDGGKVLLGGRSVINFNPNTVSTATLNNIITQDVTLGADAADKGILELAGMGADSDDTDVHVNNIIDGSVIANGDSQIIFSGLRNDKVANTITGNVFLNDHAILAAVSGGSGGENSAAGINEIGGDITFGAGSTFAVNLSPTEVTGIHVGGKAITDGTIGIVAVGTADDYQFGRTYSILHADGGVEGEFSGLSQNLALQLSLSQDANNVNLRLGMQLNTLSGTTNQMSFGNYLDDLANGGQPLPTELSEFVSQMVNLVGNGDLTPLNNYLGDTYSAFGLAGYWNVERFLNIVATHARQSHDNDWTQAFAQNAGQGAAGVGAQMSLIRQLLNSANSAPLSLSANGKSTFGKSGLWGNVSGDWLRNDGDSSVGSPDWKLNSNNVVIGYQGGNQGGKSTFTWGVTGGYHDGDLQFNNRASRGDVDGWNLGINGLWKNANKMYIHGALAYGRDDNRLNRNGAGDTKFHAKTLAGQLEIGKHLQRKSFTLTPYASLTGVNYKRDGIRESGGAGLAIDSASHNFWTSALGARIGKDFLDASGQKRGGVMAGLSWQHQFRGTDFPVRASLNGAAGLTGDSFTIYGTPLAKDSLGVQLGAYGKLARNVYGFANYSGNFGGDQKLNSISAGLGYEF